MTSDETPDGQPPDSPDEPEGRRRNWKRWVRWGLVLLVVAILSVEGYFVWPQLERAWQRIGEIQLWWVLACIVAALVSMECYAQVQRVLFRSADVTVSARESRAVIFAANSISQTMPGGQVMAPAFIYRESRAWGATPVVASWQLVMSGLLAGVGLAVLGFGGAVLAGAQASPFSIAFSFLGFFAFVIGIQYAASHPEVLLPPGRKVLGWINQIRDKPLDHGVARLERILTQLSSVKLGRRDVGESFAWSFLNRVADVACLAFACYAIGAEPGFAGLMVAFAAGKAVGTAIPLLPGGIGVVDAVLVPALTSAGMPLADAITAVLIYRIISLVLIALIGWVVIAFRYRTEVSAGDELREEMEREAGDLVEGPGPDGVDDPDDPPPPAPDPH